MMRQNKYVISLFLGMAGTVGTLGANAADIAVYDGPAIDKTSPACLTIGDAVSCSAPLLNYLAGLAPTTKTTDGGYVLATPQGPLDSFIVVTAGGGAQGNADYGPSPYVVEDGFKSNDASADSFLATGKADGTSVPLGNLNDPANNALQAAQDTPGTWDVGTNWLLNALTINGVRRELMIGFDYNQTQNIDTSLDYWALITVRDTLGGTNKADISFEIRSNPGNLSYSAFTTGKSFASMPNSTDFSTVNGVTCIDTNGSESQQFLPIPGGQCPAGYEESVNNAQSTSTTEILAFLPELNDQLAQLTAQGYDTISTRVLFGCYGRTSTGKKPGIGYLADEAQGGHTDNCDNGGFGDVFLMAGAPMPPTPNPEPATLALLGLGLGALGWSLRRRAVI